MPSNTYGRQVVEALTNKSGGSVAAGDVVIISTGNDTAFTTSTAGAETCMVGVAQETIANNGTGRVLTAGYAALINVNASVTRGNYGKTHTVAKQATDAGASRVVGVFCQFLTGGTSPTAHVFGITDASTGAGGAPSTAKYVVAAADGTLSAEIVKAYMLDNYDPDVYPGSPNAVDDEFEGGGALDAKWTATNNPAGADALNQTDLAGILHTGLLELGTDNVANYVLLTQTAPTGTAVATYRAKLALGVSGVATDDGEFATIAIGLIDTVNGISVGAGITFNNDTVTTVHRPLAQLDAAGTPGNMTTNVATSYKELNPGDWYYVELRKTTASAYTSANTYEAWISSNGVAWVQVGTCSATFTATPVLGIMCRRPKSQTGTPKAEAYADFFRRTV